MGLKDFKSYLKEGMGLLVTDGKWSGAGDLPLFLAKAVSCRLCSCNGVGFITAEVEREASLPELKRMASQVLARAGMPVAIVAQIAYCSFFGVTFRSPSVYRSISHRCVLACGTGADGAHDRVHTGDFAVLGLT